MSNHKPGEIWLVRFPFTDLTSSKVRPALVVAIHREDVIIVGIFSKVPSGTLRKTWVLLEDSHPEFNQLGLKKTSVLKAEKISAVHESVFHRQLGILPSSLLLQVQTAMKQALNLP